jgi:acyl-CoA thioesterase I
VSDRVNRRPAARGARNPRALRAVGALVLAAVAVACGGASPERDQPAPAESNAAPAPAPATESHPRIVFLGDSLTAGLGVGLDEAYPAVIGQRLRASGLDFEVVNAGVSGDTSAGGLRRLDWSLQGDARVLVLALGANDGLRGLSTAEMKRNLAAIIEAAEKRHVAVLLAGMEAPPNFGASYTRDFRQVYADLARQYRVRFIPFLLDGVAGHAPLNQADGIHPSPEGHRMIADLVWRELRPMLAPASTS